MQLEFQPQVPMSLKIKRFKENTCVSMAKQIASPLVVQKHFSEVVSFVRFRVEEEEAVPRRKGEHRFPEPVTTFES